MLDPSIPPISKKIRPSNANDRGEIQQEEVSAKSTVVADNASTSQNEEMSLLMKTGPIQQRNQIERNCWILKGRREGDEEVTALHRRQHETSVEDRTLNLELARISATEIGVDDGSGWILMNVLQFLDTVTLIQMKQVSKSWQTWCRHAIRLKRNKNGKFETTPELRTTVRTYCGNTINNYTPTPEDVERIAVCYGWPINEWDVSQIKDFSYVFANNISFNEPIQSWDTSKAMNMSCMFYKARLFNQDISGWDVSNVVTMRGMFMKAASFNQDLWSWNTAKVTSMMGMFGDAMSFSRSRTLLSWNVSNVSTFLYMFEGAESFNAMVLPWFVSEMLDLLPL